MSHAPFPQLTEVGFSGRPMSDHGAPRSHDLPKCVQGVAAFASWFMCHIKNERGNFKSFKFISINTMTPETEDSVPLNIDHGVVND